MYNGENSMVLFNGGYDYCGSREAEYYEGDEDDVKCNWCDDAYHMDTMIKREEDGERYCCQECIDMMEQFEIKEYGE